MSGAFVYVFTDHTYTCMLACLPCSLQVYRLRRKLQWANSTLEALVTGNNPDMSTRTGNLKTKGEC